MLYHKSSQLTLHLLFLYIFRLCIPNCRNDDVCIQVAAVNRFGCEGPNVEVQASPLHTTAEGGSASTSSKYYINSKFFYAVPSLKAIIVYCTCTCISVI